MSLDRQGRGVVPVGLVHLRDFAQKLVGDRALATKGKCTLHSFVCVVAGEDVAAVLLKGSGASSPFGTRTGGRIIGGGLVPDLCWRNNWANI
jgi:hypothetical protein